MNHRVLELLKAPKNIQSEDLSLLKEEIDSFPYIQNIRALYLYGVHLYDKDNYQKVLSTTAAYTTDKKILYQLINGKIQQKPNMQVSSEGIQEKTAPETSAVKPSQKTKVSGFPLKREDAPVTGGTSEIIPSNTEIVENQRHKFMLPEPSPEIKHVYVNGERNRILFEGEENFLEDENVETIDLESTLESGSIVTQKPKKSEVGTNIEVEDRTEKNDQEYQNPAAETPEEFTPETIIEEEEISSESERTEVLDESELSFHETEVFVPDDQGQINETADTQKAETISDNNVEDADTDAQRDTFASETIIDEDQISGKEEETVHNDAELSFHGMESFLPEVKIQGNNQEEITAAEVPQPDSNKHEDEMRRLIEEVEKRMKEKASAENIKKAEEPEDIRHDISFAETQSFEIQISEEKLKQDEGTIQAIEPEITEEKTETIPEEPEEIKSSWKPMSIESNLPDSLLSQPVKNLQPKEETETPETKIAPEEISPTTDETESDTMAEEEKVNDAGTETMQVVEENKEEVPVMNVSFFGSGWTIAQPEKIGEKETTEEELYEIQEEKTEAPVTVNADSNVPGFINTWQSWLKIDRTEEVEKEKVEIKTKAIEAFIENNPKISQLKEEVSFVVKEKGDDISHLMTETLANLYVEQKLYTKAIRAFEILIGKIPEKEAYFKDKIQEIKDFRNNK